VEFVHALTGSLFWAAILCIVLYATAFFAIGLLAKKSGLLKPVASGLKLVALFLAIQLFLYLGVQDHFPRAAEHFHFYSLLIFTFAAVRLALYLYGDLFVVRWKGGSFPAAFKNIITALVLVIVLLILMKDILNINVTSLIATTTVLTATIGLAFQSTLANMLAGLTIHLEKPLKQGDWISAGGHEGRVLDITLRSTRIFTPDHNEVFIPNSKVLSEAVVNYSLPDSILLRRLTVGVSYGVPPNRVKDAVLEVLSSVPGVAKSPAPLIRVTSYGDFTVHYEIRYPLTNFSQLTVTEAEIMNLLWYRFKRSGIDIPMPIRDISIRQVTPESRQAELERQAAEIMGLMEKVEILSPLSKAELKKLVERLSVMPYAAGEVPVRQGQPGDSFYIIKSGRVNVVVEKSSGETSVLATLGPGNFFGEMSLLTGAVRTASIHVTEDAEFIVIDKESFRATLANNPSIAESLSHILSERQAGLDAERERLDASAIERRRRDVSGRLLSRIRDFFGLAS
jgi:small-conductance mechanosensitive channel/CRP-like cAMP-binding protein